MQLKKIAAEETRAAAADKARHAEEEKARLATDRAKKVEQDKAAAAAKAAEDARLAAAKAEQVEEAKAAAAEQRRKEAEAAVAKSLALKQAEEKTAQAEAEEKIAIVAPTSFPPSMSRQETAKLVQSELRRVGCLAAAADGEWNASSQRSLSLFNKYAGTKFETKLASFDALDAIKAKPSRVCPLVREHGFRANADNCIKIACLAGYRVNDNNECEKVQDKKPVAAFDRRRDDARKKGRIRAPKTAVNGTERLPRNRGAWKNYVPMTN